jgi:CubicO group peptidase (beta-lactamase class C family)
MRSPSIVHRVVAATVVGLTLCVTGEGAAIRATIDTDERVATPVPHRYLHGVIPDDAKFQLALPDDWNGKLAIFSRGFSGTELTTGAFKTTALEKGYAFAASDEGWNRLTIAKEPEDSYYESRRRIRELTLYAKQVLAAHYKKGPSRTLMMGGSNGGHHTKWMIESYPDLYDGGIAGYGFNSQVSQWGSIATLLRHYDVIAPRIDDIIAKRTTEPPLTADQLTALQGIYDIPVAAANGFAYNVGRWPGSEALWKSGRDGLAGYLRDSMPRFDPTFNPGGGELTDDELRLWDPAKSPSPVQKELRRLDLTGDLKRPVIIMHGTADAIVSPGESEGYRGMVERRLGRTKAADVLAVYFIPGMGHGGREFDELIGAQFDALEQWIDHRQSGGKRGAPAPSALGAYARSFGRGESAQTGTFKAPVPRFTDANRLGKLATAFPEIDRLFREYAAAAHVPGAAWGIIIDGRLAHTGVTGYRDVPSKAPVTPDTVFRIASMTKSFTAIAILKLRDEGRLSLDDPAEKYVPEMKALVYPTSDSPRITIRHLLSHAEGFPEDNPWGDQQLANSDARLSEQIRAGIPFSNAPGVAYEYSNFGFAILGRIVANVADPSGPARTAAYTKYIRDHVLMPLGMTSTTLEPSQVPAGQLAHGYRWEDEQWKNEPLLANGSFGSMGGMLTTLSDLGKYVGAFLAAWPPRDAPEGPPIRRASLREMQQVSRPAPASVSRTANGVQLNSGGYGYGLRITQSCQYPTIVAHGGGLPGFGTQMRWLPEFGIGIIAFGNLTYTSWPRTIDAALEALARTGGLQPRVIEPSPALTSARDAVAGLVVKWDDAVADRIAAQNLFLDQSKDRRRAAIESLRAQVGACTAGSGFDRVENALRGDWTMNCERGRLRAAITLAPTNPPTVQFLDVRLAPPPDRVPAGTCPQ